MIFTNAEFEMLTQKYGMFGSWAIWEYSKKRSAEESVRPIYENLSLLNTRHIIIGLNISKPVTRWGNFRGGAHDRKLKYAFNDSSLKGCYMTDLFKNIVNSKSRDFYYDVKKRDDLIEENVRIFLDEMMT